MNLNTQATRILIGAIIGAQLADGAVRVVPEAFRNNANIVVIAAGVLYLQWGKRPRASMGDIADGIAIGIAANTAATVIRLPF